LVLELAAGQARRGAGVAARPRCVAFDMSRAKRMFSDRVGYFTFAQEAQNSLSTVSL
jgi:hypothetical protein